MRASVRTGVDLSVGVNIIYDQHMGCWYSGVKLWPQVGSRRHVSLFEGMCVHSSLGETGECQVLATSSHPIVGQDVAKTRNLPTFAVITRVAVETTGGRGE